MFKKLIFAVVTLLTVVTTFAQQAETDGVLQERAVPRHRDSWSPGGFNIQLFAAPTGVSSSLNVSNNAGSNWDYGSRDNLQSNVGVGVGYSYLPVMNIGFTTSLNWFEMTQASHGNDPNYHSDGYLLTANAAFAFNRYFNIKAGLNGIMGFSSTGNSSFSGLKDGLGYQALAGVRFNRNIGIDAGYMSMSVSGNQDFSGSTGDNTSITETIRFSGLYVGLVGTF